MVIKAIQANFLSAITANRQIGANNAKLGANLAKISSGKAINKASDGAAALSIIQALESDLKSANQAQRNISDGASLTRVAEGGLNEISSLLSRGRELSVQAANGTLSDSQRATLNNEVTAIKEEINRITGTTEFNGQKLLDGSLAPGSSNQVSVQAGIQNTPADSISLNQIDSSTTSSLGVDSVDISSQQGARDALASFDSAIQTVATNRANIGSLQNRLDSSAQNLSVTRENLASAKSTLQSLDYASETADAKKNQVMVQAGIASLTQGLQTQSSLIGSLLNTQG
ncbi:hypothetical protein MNBD_NITROSPINAE04-377 [hydrothermal vent metagenome]|uniref:Flagellin protein FlaA n=1 Tax=hydrothermal vent metagenome TaxID=652676 RepID=A0A3B1D8V2_9ZZZZ